MIDLDSELFPDTCEVVEILPHNRYVYLIQKNASSSLRIEAEEKGWRILGQQEIKDLKSIDVFLRDPVERYISGVNTFVQHHLRDTPDLDRNTCEYFATRYLFLNRHYLPQWHWIVNLARFINPECRIHFDNLDGVSEFTDKRDRAEVIPLSPEEAKALLSKNDKLEFWFFLDKVLLSLCGQSLTWREILEIYQTHPADPLSILLDPMSSVHRVLS